MQCDICGKETDEIYVILVEGSKLNVCKECSHYGRIIEVKREPKLGEKSVLRKPTYNRRIKKRDEERLFSLVPNFPKIIRDKREQLGLKQSEFAKSLSIKESLLHKIETASFEPSLKLARKLERHLNIKIIEEVSKDSAPVSSRKKTTLTLGDMVKIRKRE